MSDSLVTGFAEGLGAFRRHGAPEKLAAAALMFALQQHFVPNAFGLATNLLWALALLTYMKCHR
jgi:energy-coupling factor transporter transmembrane protein EcfT